MIIEPGTKVHIRKAFSRNREPGIYTVIQVTNSAISFRKDTGYVESITLLDLRQRVYLLELEEGNEVKFPPLLDVKSIELEKSMQDMKAYRDTIGNRRKKYRESEEVKMGRGKNLKVDTNEILDICRVYGVNKAGAEKITEKFSVTLQQAKNLIIHRYIREKLATETEALQQATGETVRTAVEAERIQEQKPKQVQSADTDAAITSFRENMANDAERLTAFAERIFGGSILDVNTNSVDMQDKVNRPVHYTTGTIEVTDYIQDKLPPEMFEGFCVGIILQYMSRYRLKGGIEDLKKARWYINRIIEAKEAV